VPDHYLDQRPNAQQAHGANRTTNEENRNGYPDALQNA